MSAQQNVHLQPNAGLIIIGNEVLSGRTQDQNVAFIAQNLNELGIVLAEVNIIPDVQDKIIETVRAFSKIYTYVFTTGGIGPTHDDITAGCIANAFDVPLELNQKTADLLTARYAASGFKINEAQLKMARIPKGAQLIPNPVTQIPGFFIENVYVFAGVPAIMRAMFEGIAPSLKHGIPIQSKTIHCYLGEGRLAEGLEKIQKDSPKVEIGSYPFWSVGKHGVSIVVRGIDTALIAQAAEDVGKLMRRFGGEPEYESSEAPR